jgi:dTDP-4-dehydrorhamnose 3,5-epimerase-like enzyme
MEVIKTDIDGVVIIEPRVFRDERGYFFESFSQKEFDEYNRENETSSNLKTKRAKCLFFRFLFSLPFAGSKA